MGDDTTLRLSLRRQELVTNAQGYTEWRVEEGVREVPASKVAVLVCDMWDNHWSRGAVERENAFVGRLNDVVCAARERGVLIVHAPSETMDFYADHPARRKMSSLPVIAPPPDLDHADPPLPVDDSDGGSDTGEADWHKAWTRQHPAIEVRDEDAISDQGKEIYSLLQTRGIEQVLIMGVHTGMCVLHRSFGIKQMVRWGVNIALVRDLTDAMYNPARSPYVSHWEGVELIVRFIEKFWCPTVTSADLVG
jgi:nicotinamidase-related amidase